MEILLNPVMKKVQFGTTRERAEEWTMHKVCPYHGAMLRSRSRLGQKKNLGEPEPYIAF